MCYFNQNFSIFGQSIPQGNIDMNLGHADDEWMTFRF